MWWWRNWRDVGCGKGGRMVLMGVTSEESERWEVHVNAQGEIRKMVGTQISSTTLRASGIIICSFRATSNKFVGSWGIPLLNFISCYIP